MSTATSPDTTMDLKTIDGKLALVPEDSGHVFIDFIGGKKAHRRQFGGGKGQPLARAVGITSQKRPTILDATAGMGGDAFVFATLGCKVHMVERNHAVAALLEDALKRANQAAEAGIIDQDLIESIQRMSITNADTAEYLLSDNFRNHNKLPEVVYMDPMYPEKKKKAAAKKEMKALQTLVGPDLDSEKLLYSALKTATYRVVVKRPKNAPPIEGPKPSANISSPNTRYDIYSIKALQST